eukprot:IDg6483t1
MAGSSICKKEADTFWLGERPLDMRRDRQSDSLEENPPDEDSPENFSLRSFLITRSPYHLDSVDEGELVHPQIFRWHYRRIQHYYSLESNQDFLEGALEVRRSSSGIFSDFGLGLEANPFRSSLSCRSTEATAVSAI